MGRKINNYFFMLGKGTAVLLSVSLVIALLSPYINPFYCWIPALFGLAYPAIWLALTINAVILIRFRKWFYILLIFLLAGTPMMLKHFSLPLKSGNSSKSDSYSVISFNVHGFAGLLNGKSSYDRQKLVHDFINGQHPSVVCMQEYALKGSRHARYLTYLNSGLKLPFKHISSFDQEHKGTSYTFLTSSDFAMRQEGVIFTMETELCGIFSDIEFPEGIVRVYNIHLQSVKLISERQLLTPHKELPVKKNIFNNVKGTIAKLRTAFRIRSYQAIAVSESISKCPYPVIIAGDFNDTPASFSYRILNNGLKDAAFLQGTGFHRTFAESLYPIRIDHILVSDKLRVYRYTRHKIWLSDHFPVSTSFGFK